MELLTAEQVAEMLHVQPSTLATWRHRGVGPAYVRVGPGDRARVMYRREAIDAWLREQERLPAA